jgi:hypothetical protein
MVEAFDVRLIAAGRDGLDAPVLVEVLEAGADELRAFVRAHCARLAIHSEDVSEHRRRDASLALLDLSGIAMTHRVKRSKQVSLEVSTHPVVGG